MFYILNVCCVYSLESNHGDSNEYTQHTFTRIKEENLPKLSVYRIWRKSLRTQERVPLIRCKRAIGVRATEVLLYIHYICQGMTRKLEPMLNQVHVCVGQFNSTRDKLCYYAPVIEIPIPTGTGNSGTFNFSVCKALVNALHCSDIFMVKSLLKAPVPLIENNKVQHINWSIWINFLDLSIESSLWNLVLNSRRISVIPGSKPRGGIRRGSGVSAEPPLIQISFSLETLNKFETPWFP